MWNSPYNKFLKTFIVKAAERFLPVLLFGLPLAAAMTESFGLPDFHHGNYERLLFFGSIVCGILCCIAMYRLKRCFVRFFKTPLDAFLTLALSAGAAWCIWIYADPYTYVETRFAVSPAVPENKNQIRLGGVYPRAEKSMPLLGIHSFEPFDPDEEHDRERDLRNLFLGTPHFEKMFFSVSRHKLESGVYVKSTRRLPLKIECAGEAPYVVTVPQRSDYAAIALPVSDQTLSPQKRFQAADWIALPGILLAGLFCAVYIRKLAFLTLYAPRRLPVHAAFLLAIAGFCLTWHQFELGYSNDPVGQFRQGLRGVYQEWHPPIMAFLWIHLTRFTEWLTGYFSPAEPFCLFMRIPYWIGFFLMARYAVKRGGGFAGVLLMMLPAYAPFFFREYQFIFSYAWKDCLLVSCYVFALGLVLNLETLFRRRDLTPGKICLLLTALLFFVIGTGVRSNAVLAALPLACLFFLPFFDVETWKGIGKTLLCGALLFSLTVSFLYVFHYPILKTVRQTPLSYPMFKEILAIRQLSGDREWPAFLEKRFRDDFDRRYQYHKHNGNTDFLLHGTLRLVELPAEHYHELKKFWLRKVKEHPAEYLEQKWDSFYRTMRTYKRPVSLLNPWHVFWGALIALLFSALMILTGGRGKKPCRRGEGTDISWLGRQGRRRRGGPWEIRELLTVFLLALSALSYLSTYWIFAFVADFRYLSWTLYGGILSTVCFFLLFRSSPEQSAPEHPGENTAIEGKKAVEAD